jgi:SWI/SNF-related matrix-associated actin-dependent regulator 1 of chromatin subfamily A
MHVTVDGNLYVVECSREQRAQFRAAGFKWHQDRQALVTDSAKVAARLRQYADESAKVMINNAFIKVKPWTGRIPYPQGLKPLPFQPGAANFALSRNRSYLALDPGLGKTIVAALIMNALELQPIVIIVPPFLALNTKEEFLKWSTRGLRILIHGDPPGEAFPHVYIIPDSLIADPLGNHDEMYKRIDAMQTYGEILLNNSGMLFVDEAHRYKNIETQRTAGLYRSADKFERVVFLSGTPMPNRPLELYAILSRFAPETIDFKSLRQFGMRYCAGYFDGYDYDYKGASNVKELASKVRGLFMLRLRKKDVLRDLPPKTEELIFLAEDLPPKMAAVERQHLAKHSPEDLMRKKFTYKDAQGEDVDAPLATYRRKLGLAKVPLAVAYVKDILDESHESVIVFAEHTEVIARLAKGLAKFNPAVITGKVPKEKRQGIVKRFQNDKRQRLFIGNIKACGVGFNITKASRVVFAEFSWVPGDNDQAADRAHRHGQKNHVLVQYLVFKNSIDKVVMETNLKKRKTTQLL